MLYYIFFKEFIVMEEKKEKEKTLSRSLSPTLKKELK